MWREDIAANRGNPKGTFVVLFFRLAQWARTTLPRPLAIPVLGAYRATADWLLGIELPASTQIGPGLALRHASSIVVHADAVIGADCRLSQGVTIGERRGGVPRLGDRVAIGNGAQILGPITLHDGAVVGAGAIVVHDVPADHVAIGPAARIQPHS